MSILPFSISLSNPHPQNLSFSRVLSLQTPLFLQCNLSISQISLKTTMTITTTIRMGGGPRTYPGGVSKWQWKHMQAKKAKQLLKARLVRERQIYEMRKRAELRAAISELERPWEPVQKAPTLFSVSADEQLKVLADRFQKPGGFDLWSDRDGPQLFETPDSGGPSKTFFPKGVIPCGEPFRRIGVGDANERLSLPGGVSGGDSCGSARREGNVDGKGKAFNKFGKRRRGRKFGRGGSNDSKEQNGNGSADAKERVVAASKICIDRSFGKGTNLQKPRGSNAEICDTTSQQDGSYKF